MVFDIIFDMLDDAFLFLEIMMLIMTALSLAVLFVYRPKRFKALPWIVLAIMELTFFVSGIVDFHDVLLWFDGMPLMISFDNFFDDFSRLFMYFRLSGWTVLRVSAIPILALWVMLIVGAVQKKKKAL